MELFTLIVRNRDESYIAKLYNHLISKLDHLHNLEDGVQLRMEFHDHYSAIYATLASCDFELHTAAKVYECVGIALADHILEKEEQSILRGLMREFKFQEASDVAKIEGYCRQFLYGEGELLDSIEEAKDRRHSRIAGQIAEYLQENNQLVLEGFLRFRLQEYIEDMREVVEYAIDEFMMDRQYQEFISLLKYFVYMQEAKIPAAHLIHKGGHEFAILNEKLQPIDTNDFDASFTLEVLEKDINFEDMIVSTLITVAPAAIFIHTREPEMQVIKTIMQIFEERTTLCSYCRMCHSILGEIKKQDQLYP